MIQIYNENYEKQLKLKKRGMHQFLSGRLDL